MQKQSDAGDETRSLASEYDYGQKRRFVDIMSGHKPKKSSFRFEQEKQALDKEYSSAGGQALS
eukprot:CAMPEP_0202970112 /NCGR_PEP_ID=MMETSP1396-20130829/16092_1 /ASSEMBLY_ACC=CAM_ASM_000872 /TAXON_ID= /ORGANISM="Pseudokeronopsis sp., Strain Brazil" /LENGTH=62 /DNA_ID=CAMNT_0049698407 /DNA_START=221 /DNA_END=405 /DNA_ORIENTATION=-